MVLIQRDTDSEDERETDSDQSSDESDNGLSAHESNGQTESDGTDGEDLKVEFVSSPAERPRSLSEGD